MGCQSIQKYKHLTSLSALRAKELTGPSFNGKEIRVEVVKFWIALFYLRKRDVKKLREQLERHFLETHKTRHWQTLPTMDAFAETTADGVLLLAQY